MPKYFNNKPSLWTDANKKNKISFCEISEYSKQEKSKSEPIL